MVGPYSASLSMAQKIALLPPDQREEMLAGLDAEKLMSEWSFWARPGQIPDPGPWTLWLYMAGRGCIAGDVRLDLADGTTVPVAAACAAGEPLAVRSLDLDGNLIDAKSEAPFIKGIEQVYTVTTTVGQVAVTGGHRFLTSSGWLHLRDLTPSDHIATPDGFADILNIQPRGIEVFYDLYVPGFENYLAEGVIHSNSGKTRSASEWLHQRVRDGHAKRIALLGRTAADVRDVMVQGNALALDTTVPTPDGWTTMGELRAGDIVLGGDGKPCTVLNAFPVLHERPCYKLTFKSGATVIADADHQWWTWDWMARMVRSSGRSTAKHRPRVRTTVDLTESIWHKGARNYAVELTPAWFESDQKELPVDPYTFGVWLGDGHSRGNEMTLADKDAEHILGRISRMYPISQQARYGDRAACAYTLRGIKPILRSMGVLHNKHIPIDYLRAPYVDRLAVLQGLMDTDGHVTEGGHAEIITIYPQLRDDIVTLLASLGIRSGVGRKPAATIKGLAGKLIQAKGAHRIQFRTDVPVASLDRHLIRMGVRSPWEQKYDYLKSVEPVESVPVRCIEVDSPDHLFLVTERYIPTHNSGLIETARPDERPLWEPSKRRLTWPGGAYALAFCADPETRALTPEGWRTHDELSEGDLIRVLDMDTGLSRWSPIQKMHRFDVEHEPMVSVEQNYHSSFVTLAHRWPVMNKATRRRGWRESLLDFTTKDSFITGAAGDDLPTEAKYSDALVALVGWYTAEGHISTFEELPTMWRCADREGFVAHVQARKQYLGWTWAEIADRMGTTTDTVRNAVWNGATKPETRELLAHGLAIAASTLDGFFEPVDRRTLGSITQNADTSSEAEIRARLTEEFGPAVPSFMDLRRPAWRDTATRGGSKTNFLLNHEALLVLSEHARGRDKVVTHEFIRHLTRSQLETFVRAVIDGDGSWKESGRVAVIAQKVDARLDAVELAAILLGWSVRRQSRYSTLAVSKVPRLVMPGTRPPNSKIAFDAANLTFNMDPRPVAPVHSLMGDRRQIAEYTGIVWCPQVAEGTWLAKRHGTVYYTGNSSDEPDQLRGPQFDTAWCIAEGEPVLTSRGWKPIETIRPGERVLTRSGYWPVAETAMRGEEPVLEVSTEASRTICSYDHRVLVGNHRTDRWVAANDLRDGDLLHVRPTNVEVTDIAVQRSTLLPVTSVLEAGTARVWTLSVNGRHEYFGGGLLSRNCDEFASFPQIAGVDGASAFDNLRLGLRLPVDGDMPRMVATTTPRRVPSMFKVLEESKDPRFGIAITRGTTYDNLANLADAYSATILGLYEGTRLGQQELMGEMLSDVEGALFKQEHFDVNRVPELPVGKYITVVGVDPSVAERPKDECGIVVVKATTERDYFRRHLYVMEDASLLGSPAAWSKVAVAMAAKWAAPIVAEGNQGGALVRMAIGQVNPNVPVYIVHAKEGKATRAEPVAALGEQGRLHLVGFHPMLEAQAASWVPAETRDSPDRTDAMVWAALSLITKIKGATFGTNRTLRARSFRDRRLPPISTATLAARGRR